MSDFMRQNNENTYHIGKYLFMFAAIVACLIPHFLYATGSPPSTNAISQVVCNVVSQLTGGIGQAISTVAVIFIGIGLFMGKISWGLALGIAIGMAMLFGAENIVGWIGGDTVTCVKGNVISTS